LEWLPLLHNFIFFVQDVNEFAVRTNAAFGMQRFIESCALANGVSDNVADAGDMMTLLDYTLIPAMKKVLKNHTESIRSEMVSVLEKAMEAFPQHDFFSSLAPLGKDSKDPEDDSSILANIYHMQLHRRIRALRRLTLVLQEGQLQSQAVNHVIVPLVLHFIYESDKVKEHNVVNEAIQTLGVAGKMLSWGPYHALIRGSLRSIAKRPEIEKVLIRLVVSVLDEMHFDLSQAGDIQDAVVLKLLPELFNHLKQEKGEDEALSVRVPVALAIAKLLKLLPEDVAANQLPKLLVMLCQLMKSKLQDVRDSTRATLVKINLVLGPKALGTVVGELKNALTRGPQLHVLGYTVHTLLTEIVPLMHPGDLDATLGLVTSILMDDIFGNVAAEKEVDIVKNKMKETKATRSFDSFELLAKAIRFETSITHLLQPVRQVMQTKDDFKSIQKVGLILKRIAIGLNHNDSVHPRDLLIFVHGLLTESLPVSKVEEERARERTAFDKTFTVLPFTAHQLAGKGRPVHAAKSQMFASHSFQFIEFGQSLLLSALKRDRIPKDLVGMLDPLVPILGESLFSKHVAVTVGGLKLLSILVKWNLGKLEQDGPVVVKRVFDLVAKSSNSATDLVQNCFRFLTVVMRDVSWVKVSQKQISGLIRLIQPDLQDTERQSTTFGLVRAILSQKVVVEEVYDLMDQVSNIMITNQTSQVREVCRQAWLQFLLEYPHGHGRLKTQFTFLTSNLAYKYPTGRESAMEMLSVLLDKLNDAVLFEFAEQFFVVLVMSLVNDDNASCREMAGALVKKLVGRLDGPRLDLIWNVLMKWLSSSGNPVVVRAATQVLGLIFELDIGKRFLDKIPLERLMGTLEAEDWQLLYATLVAVSKFCRFAPQYSEEWKPMWRQVVSLLIHPHAWVRMQSARLLGTHLHGLEDQGGLIESELVEKEAVVDLAHKLVLQLKSPHLTPEAATQTVKLLFFVGKRLLVWQDSQEHDLMWLVQKLCVLVRLEQAEGKTLQRQSVFQWFAVMTSFLSGEQVKPLLPTMIMALYQTVKDDTFKGDDADALKRIGQEVMDLIQKKGGPEAYFEAYNAVHLKVQQKRRSRREEKSVVAVSDPARASKRKIQRNDMKKSAKKRKTEVQMQKKGKRKRGE
jgi:U3 small nucleolar RNA-associated protein 20